MILMYVPPLPENGTIFLYLKVGWLPKICSSLGIHIGRTGSGATTRLSALCWPGTWTMTPHPWPTSLWKAGKSAADVLSISSDVQCWMCDTQEKMLHQLLNMFQWISVCESSNLRRDCAMKSSGFGGGLSAIAVAHEDAYIWGFKARAGSRVGQRVFWRPMLFRMWPPWTGSLLAGARVTGVWHVNWRGSLKREEQFVRSELTSQISMISRVGGSLMHSILPFPGFPNHWYFIISTVAVPRNMNWPRDSKLRCKARAWIPSLLWTDMKLNLRWNSRYDLSNSVELMFSWKFLENSLKFLETTSNYIKIVMKMMWNHQFFGVSGKPWYLLRGLVPPVDLMPWFDGWGSPMSSFKKRKSKSYIEYILYIVYIYSIYIYIYSIHIVYI